jgi:DNA-directed RNA polymerase subunit RPC12/RpoP
MDQGLIFVPLLICGMLGIMMAVATGFSYLWLRHVEAEAKRCPHCQSKGAGDVLEYEMIEEHTYIETDAKGWLPRRHRRRAKPVRVEKKKYKVDYRCSQCGHEWTGVAMEEERKPSE